MRPAARIPRGEPLGEKQLIPACNNAISRNLLHFSISRVLSRHVVSKRK
jgi:hypothetical protein